MMYIQDPLTLGVTGHCCICEGARAEIEYEKKLSDLKKAYETDCANLRSEYSNKLSFNTDRLIRIKHRIELGRSCRDLTHFNTINGKEIHDIYEM